MENGLVVKQYTHTRQVINRLENAVQSCDHKKHKCMMEQFMVIDYGKQLLCDSQLRTKASLQRLCVRVCVYLYFFPE
jgi:flagellar biosynthesis chaperone FliJ